MSNDDLKAILEMDDESRYDYFIGMVGEEREVWILVNDDEQFLKLHSEDQDAVEYLPLWPLEAFAQEYAKGETDLKPRGIPLPQFLNRWLPGLGKDGISVGVFPSADDSVWIIEAEELEQDLRDELAQF